MQWFVLLLELELLHAFENEKEEDAIYPNLKIELHESKYVFNHKNNQFDSKKIRATIAAWNEI